MVSMQGLLFISTLTIPMQAIVIRITERYRGQQVRSLEEFAKVIEIDPDVLRAELNRNRIIDSADKLTTRGMALGLFSNKHYVTQFN